MELTLACDVSERARPTALDASSTVPKASTRGSSFRARPPPSRPVVPSPPVPASSSIRFLRARAGSCLLEDLAEVVQLLGHAPCFLDHLGQGDHLDVAIAPDRDHPALAADDQLDRRDAKPGRPDAV